MTIVTIFEKKIELLLKSQMNNCFGGRNYFHSVNLDFVTSKL
jgi:hypothetical protein